MRTTITLLLLSCLACRNERAVDPATQPPAHQGLPPLAGGAAPTAAAPVLAAPAAAPGLTGSVLERIDAPPYTYLRLKTAAGEQWSAVSAVEVKVGDTVTIANPMQMENFESKTLKRKFDKIIFGTVAGAPAAAAAPAAPAAAAPAAPSGDVGKGHTTVAAEADVKVDRAQGPNGKTIAEVFANKTTLNNQSVAVRGKVVKYNGGIMGKNWLHIQDGSGTEAKGDHDIAVTTTDDAKVGDIVAVTGQVHLDRDFGAGYAYSVIIEDAKLQR